MKGKLAARAGLEQAVKLRLAAFRFRPDAYAKLLENHLRVDSKSRQDVCSTGHRSEGPCQFAFTALLKGPCDEADCSDAGDDAESLSHSTRTRWAIDKIRFVHGLLQIRDEHGPPEDRIGDRKLKGKPDAERVRLWR